MGAPGHSETAGVGASEGPQQSPVGHSAAVDQPHSDGQRRVQDHEQDYVAPHQLCLELGVQLALLAARRLLVLLLSVPLQLLRPFRATRRAVRGRPCASHTTCAPSHTVRLAVLCSAGASLGLLGRRCVAADQIEMLCRSLFSARQAVIRVEPCLFEACCPILELLPRLKSTSV